MNTEERLPVDFDDRVLDLLVDGELSEPERRKLLTSFDAEPGAWRRCALAFLEAQEFAKTMPRLLEPATHTSPAKPAAVVASAKRKGLPLGTAGTLLAMAASFLLAVWITGAGQQVWRAGQSLGDLVAGNRPDADRARPGASPDETGKWRTVTVAFPSSEGGPPAAVDVPAIESNSLNEDWLQQFPPVLTRDARDRLGRAGYYVSQQRNMMPPVPMNDGRKFVAPVDRVEVQFVGDKAY
ncbi:MAG: hypothetical protein ACOY3P_21560 [Planctomycetota bacterium]